MCAASPSAATSPAPTCYQKALMTLVRLRWPSTSPRLHVEQWQDASIPSSLLPLNHSRSSAPASTDGPTALLQPAASEEPLPPPNPHVSIAQYWFDYHPQPSL
ncbi:Os08g0278400 [Oryza sativa Japonica Group]|uniref:Os08g0278400 protein n=1 Tax=Oryza sativa subsp. japonica TaxID=39947 RepID=A0A0P0XDQ6_ORYSJ|nr:Os08g0278400 [Oryza sativa Japonica Group]